MTEEEVTVETIQEKIAKALAAKKVVAEKAIKEAEELEKLADLDEDVMVAVESVKEMDEDIAEQKKALDAEIAPYAEKVTAAKKAFDENTKDVREAREAEYKKVVESVGETGAKMLTGKGASIGTGTRSGRGRSGATRAQVITAICDEGLSFEEAALKYDHMGDGERSGKQKVGTLVKRHIDLAIKEDGTVVKNDDGTYSRA